jgi:hypothetical protein
VRKKTNWWGQVPHPTFSLLNPRALPSFGPSACQPPRPVDRRGRLEMSGTVQSPEGPPAKGSCRPGRALSAEPALRTGFAARGRAARDLRARFRTRPFRPNHADQWQVPRGTHHCLAAGVAARPGPGNGRDRWKWAGGAGDPAEAGRGAAGVVRRWARPRLGRSGGPGGGGADPAVERDRAPWQWPGGGWGGPGSMPGAAGVLRAADVAPG